MYDALDTPVNALGTVVHLRASGVALIVDVSGPGLPVVAHWGRDLGDLTDKGLREYVRSTHPPRATNGVDGPVRVSVVPEGSTGWTGAPGLSGHRGGRAWSTAFELTSAHVEPAPEDPRCAGGLLRVLARDVAAELALELHLELLFSGLLRARAVVTNTGTDDYVLDSLAIALPLPNQADEILDLAGRWAKERVPQRMPIRVGMHLREGRHGRTGADAPFVTVAGAEGFGFERGEVWGLHVAWSGNHRSYVERAFSSERLIAGGELLLPGEIVLGPGEQYATPVLLAGHGEGLDELAGRFHRHIRSRAQHPRSARPVVLNVWEAVYFDQDPARLTELADHAAKVGVERFVLDDGWFRGRRDDTAGLGDWFVDDAVWPGDSLQVLVDHVHSLGMSFGLWLEPEMANLDSDLVRAHPDWLLQVPGRLPVAARHQQVLDLARRDVSGYLLERIVALVTELGIDALKWDHNRDLVDAGSGTDGRPGIHAQTAAVYQLLDDVRRACPGLEIECCSSGGGRIDLEILERTERVWASDCIDAHERQQIQRWTAQLLPPELVGSHVGADRAHTTGRRLDLAFRAGTALFGSFGIEWDLTDASDAELEELAAWVETYKEHRALLHSGVTVRADPSRLGVWLHGVVAPDRDEALYAIVCTDRPVTWPPGRLRLPGLDPSRSYRVLPTGPNRVLDDHRVAPPWWETGLTLPGSALLGAGLQVPALQPDQLVLVHVSEMSR